MKDVTVLEYERIEPGRLGRCSWESEQAARDAALLAWIGRFRFVTAQAVAVRFGVSWQSANARLRRLERRQLIGFERQHVSQARAVFLTGRGHELLGWPRRKTPRAEVQREHEDAIVLLVTELERKRPDSVVLTERECRQLEARGGHRVYSVSVAGTSRWPDAVVESDGGREAFEIEFAPKGTDRLARIVRAYESSDDYVRTTFMVRNVALGRRIARQRSDLPPSLKAFRAPSEIVVVPWIGLDSQERSVLATKLGS